MRVSRKISTHTLYLLLLFFVSMKQAEKKHAPHPPLKQAKQTQKYIQNETRTKKREKNTKARRRKSNQHLFNYLFLY